MEAGVQRGHRRLAVGRQACGALGRERGEHGEADRAADLHGRVDQAGGEARSPRRGARHRERHQRREARGRRRCRSGSSRAARRPRRCRRPACGRTAAGRRRSSSSAGISVALGAEAHRDAAREAQRQRAHHDRRWAGTPGRPRAGRSRGSAAGTARRGRTCRTCRRRRRPCTRFAPATLRERNRRSGISGFAIARLAGDERGDQRERDGAEDERARSRPSPARRPAGSCRRRASGRR